ncbi:DUF6196 family protein [Actinoplanes awajinensis]|uniref:Uncharacterized protein n=1 Tax=Actinoplanes awajinensis subsp. mycoplanecinus TaxID=135947 RepID=A0A0X3UP01_9ACTN|nr:DUF6196 family protein [Actinoplanes awajinensis]KUL34264.1 hypothetical protein ADL15_16660 [Actinoplanes awajinensis subsp. mycoplanecinus]
MVSISQESVGETDRRLRRVVAAADLVTFDGEWSFFEAPLDRPPVLTAELLAVVRDDDRWSWLAPSGASEGERFAVFSFHFPPGVDNSGFVGWLATEFKRRLGTGVFVICGQNSDRGGIYDYWGCPAQLRAEAAEVLADLRTGG